LLRSTFSSCERISFKLLYGLVITSPRAKPTGEHQCDEQSDCRVDRRIVNSLISSADGGDFIRKVANTVNREYFGSSSGHQA